MRPTSAHDFDELVLNVTGHEAAFLGFDVGALEAGEVHVGAGEGDAGGLLVMQEELRVHLFDAVEVFLKAAGVVGGFAENVGEVDVVEREHFADDIEDAVGEDLAHLVELLQEPGEDAAFDDVLALLGLGGDEVEGVDSRVPARCGGCGRGAAQGAWDSTAGRS